MEEKISIASCSGMSALGLIGRATCNDLATENENILSICITATSADNEKFTELIKKYPILSINGCSDACVDKILKTKGVEVQKTVNIDKIFEAEDMETKDPSRLDNEGEEAVKKLKVIIKEEIDSM